MLAKQENNQIDFSDGSIVLPEQVDFYLRDKNDYRLVPNIEERLVVPSGLKDAVEKSDLFSEEDKKEFVFE